MRDQESKRATAGEGAEEEEREGVEEGAWRTGRSLRSSAGSSAAAGRGDLDGAARAALHGKASRFASDNGATTKSSSLPFARVILFPFGRALPARGPRTFHRGFSRRREALSRVGCRIITCLHRAIVERNVQDEPGERNRGPHADWHRAAFLSNRIVTARYKCNAHRGARR